MQHSVDLYRKTAFVLRYLREVPLAWFIVGLGVAWAGIFIGKSFSAKQRLLWLRRCALAAGLLVVCTYLALNLDSLRSFLIQQDEANILSISAASLRGLPMYHPPVSPNFSYSLMYGPYTFLIYSVALAIGGINHFWIIRAAVVLASFVACAALFILLRRSVSAFTAFCLMTLPLSVLLQYPGISLSACGDIWIFLCAALAILSSQLEVELFAVLLTGVLGGLIAGFKISAAPAILFPLLILYRRFGPRALVYSLLSLTAVGLAPFALPNISLPNYIAWVQFTRSEGISAASAFSNLLFALFLISPCLIIELNLRRSGSAFRRRVPEFLLILLCLFVAILTSKNGSGLHYLWHVVPSIVVYMGLAAKDMSAMPDENKAAPVYYIAVACALFTCAYIPRNVAGIRESMMPPVVTVARQSIDRYLDRYKDRSSVQMGYGSADVDYLSDLRYVLIYKGQPYAFEGNTGRFETMLLPFPANALNRMANCKDDVWLVPHSQQPFDLYLFPEGLGRTFLQNYSVDSSDGIYDAWVCNRAKSQEVSPPAAVR